MAVEICSAFLFAVCLAIFASTTQADKVCYGKYGCFSNNPPFDSLLVELPQTPEEIATTYTLFTPETTSESGEILDPDQLSTFRNSTFNKHYKLKIIIHGFMQSGRRLWIKSMREELMKREKMNVVVVDWEQGSNALNMYETAVGNTRLVGAQIAVMILVLKSEFGYNMTNVHIIGHSLGAHVAGHAGTHLAKQIGRITGLDPARPEFDVDHPAVRLDPSDAQFVDVIHTDAGTDLLQGSLGLSRPCGHVDFYPNGGETQPGCVYIRNVGDILANLRNIYNAPLPWLFACDHMKVINYFIESINRACVTRAYPCDNWEAFKEGACFQCNGACARMGYDADKNPKNVTGKFYMLTSEQAPYCAPLHYLSVTLKGLKNGNDLFNSIIAKKVKIELIGNKGTASSSKARYLDELGSVNSGQMSLLVHSEDAIPPGKLNTIIVKYHGRPLYVGEVVVHDGHHTYSACYKRYMSSLYTFWSYSAQLVMGTKGCATSTL